MQRMDGSRLAKQPLNVKLEGERQVGGKNSSFPRMQNDIVFRFTTENGQYS